VANFPAIAVVSRAIVGLLEETCSPEDFPVAQFDIFKSEHFEKPPEKFQKSISLYLFRVGFNTSRRNLHREARN